MTLWGRKCQNLPGCGERPGAGGVAIGVKGLLVDLVICHDGKQLFMVHAVEADRDRLRLSRLGQDVIAHGIARSIELQRVNLAIGSRMTNNSGSPDPSIPTAICLTAPAWTSW